MKGLLACACALVMLSSVSAQANDDGLTGLYIGGKLGASIERFGDGKFGWAGGSLDYLGTAYTWSGNKFGMGSNRDTVFSGGVNIGYDFGKRTNVPIRLELDYTLRGNASDYLQKPTTTYMTVNGLPASEDAIIGVKTSIRLQTAMLNAWYDIPTGTALTPYLGGGIGVAFIRHKSTAIENPGTDDQEVINNSKNFSNFAWSLGGGVAYNINDNWALDVGYRYIDAGDHKMHYKGADSFLFTQIDKIESHDIMLGFRYGF